MIEVEYQVREKESGRTIASGSLEGTIPYLAAFNELSPHELYKVTCERIEFSDPWEVLNE